jgi:tRNA threonylcarbamoyladenosine biosynthesis protein TsaB
MSLILSIETATKICSVALHEKEALIGQRKLNVDKSHSKFLAPMIHELFDLKGRALSDLSAVAVSKGPGSYTGLRIGTSTAKGICYALDIPLIAVNTLLAMCHEAGKNNPDGYHLCPMLDARRMEVYTLITDHQLNIKKATRALIIQEDSFKEELDRHPIIFFGAGMPKARPFLEKNPQAFFMDHIQPAAESVGHLALAQYQKGEFENLEAFEPFYLKDFIATVPRKLI